jgi:hypothetical protein
MPFESPLDVDKAAYPNVEQQTVHVASGTLDATITNASIDVAGTVDANITNASIDVAGTVDANITNANIDATVSGNIIVDSGTIQVGGVDTPVMVQGGGEILHTTSGSLAAGVDTNINIPAPPSGLTYFGLGLIISVTAKTISSDVPLVANIYNFGALTGNPVKISPVLATVGPATYRGAFGANTTAQIVVPIATTYPIVVNLFNSGASGTQFYDFTAIGLSYADSFPRDMGQWVNGNEPTISFSNVVAGSYAVIAPSLETRNFLLVSRTGSAGEFYVEVLNNNGTWTRSQNRADHSVYGNVTPGGSITANSNSLITIPGTGHAHRIVTAPATTGLIDLAYLGKVA